MTTLYFYIDNNNYRSGYNIYTFTEQSDDNLDELFEITFEIPNCGYRLYLVNEFPDYKPIWYKDFTDENINNIYLKTFTQIHDCMPFVVSGWTPSYVEEGEYPEVTEEIENMEDVLPLEIVNEIEENDEGNYFIIFIDNNGDELSTQLLRPI